MLRMNEASLVFIPYEVAIDVKVFSPFMIHRVEPG